MLIDREYVEAPIGHEKITYECDCENTINQDVVWGFVLSERHGTPSAPIPRESPPPVQRSVVPRVKVVMHRPSTDISTRHGAHSANAPLDWRSQYSEYSVGSPGTQLPRTSSLGKYLSASPAETKKFEHLKLPPTSSYWRVNELEMFPKYLGTFGKNWHKIAEEMGTKTSQQIKNYFSKNADALGFKKIAEDAETGLLRSATSVVLESQSKILL